MSGPLTPSRPDRERYLAEFLTARGSSVAEFQDAVDTTFGDPYVVVVTGSIPAGFGTPTSDLDLYAIVPGDDALAQIPINTHKERIRFDTQYFSEGQLRSWRDRLDEPWPLADRLTRREDWAKRFQLLNMTSRFALSAPLVVDTRREHAWTEWLEGLQEGWLIDRLVDWWRWEARRHRCAAGLLDPDDVDGRAFRLSEAVIAALQARAVSRGDAFMNPKWLPRKLARAGDDEALALFRRMLSVALESSGPEEPAALEAELAGLGVEDEAGVEAVLTLAPGTSVHGGHGRQLLSLWNLSGAEVRPPMLDLDALRAGAPVWRGKLDESPPEWVRRLFARNLLWLSLSRGGTDA